MVGALVVFAFLGVAQVAAVQHARMMLADAAAEGARIAARADRTDADGLARTRELVASSLSPTYPMDAEAGRVIRDGLSLVAITVTAPVPVLGLPGPAGMITVTGHALEEQP